MKLILALMLITTTYGYSEEAPKKPSLAEEAFNKAIEANTKECDKAYLAYQKALEEANKRIIKSLECVKADLNDTKKYGKLSITDRAKALEEVEGKIAEVKKGALGSVVVERNEKEGDLLGDAGVDLKKMIVGKWVQTSDSVPIVFDGKGLAIFGEKLHGKVFVIADKVTIKWDNGVVYNLTYNANDIIDVIDNTGFSFSIKKNK